MSKKKKILTEADLTKRLATKHPAPAWAFLSQVRNCTGFSRQVRTADAIAMSLWPSRGLELHGFEIKSRRSDWLRELKTPDKAEEIASFCHRWWVVANAGVVEEAELPPLWGLMIPHTRGLKVVKHAELQEAKAPTYPFLASLLRRVSESHIPIDSVQERLEDRFQDGLAHQKQLSQYEVKKAERLKEAVAQFEQAAGLKITEYSGSDELGTVVKMVQATGYSRIKGRLRRDRKVLLNLVGQFDEAIDAMEETE